MAKQKMESPRLEIWKNKSKKYGYRLIGRNGENIMGNPQGWSRIAGVVKNVISIYRVGGDDVVFKRNMTGEIAGVFTFMSGNELNIYWVPAPGTKKK
jgi:hypothetical protein